MRLITHNLLCCVGCQHYPLTVEADKVEPAVSALDGDFIRRLLARLDYSILASGVKDVTSRDAVSAKSLADFSPTLPTDLSDAAPAFAAIHVALNCVEIMSGRLKCSKCNQTFAINDGIPDMLPK